MRRRRAAAGAARRHAPRRPSPRLCRPVQPSEGTINRRTQARRDGLPPATWSRGETWHVHWRQLGGGWRGASRRRKAPCEVRCVRRAHLLARGEGKVRLCRVVGGGGAGGDKVVQSIEEGGGVGKRRQGGGDGHRRDHVPEVEPRDACILGHEPTCAGHSGNTGGCVCLDNACARGHALLPASASSKVSVSTPSKKGTGEPSTSISGSCGQRRGAGRCVSR